MESDVRSICCRYFDVKHYLEYVIGCFSIVSYFNVILLMLHQLVLCIIPRLL